MQPIIGIIGNFNGALIPEHANLPISYIGQGYLDAVKKAGGIPVIIPPKSSLESISALIDRIDGLLLPGGKDIDPYFYDEEPSLKLGRSIRPLMLLRSNFYAKLMNAIFRL